MTAACECTTPSQNCEGASFYFPVVFCWYSRLRRRRTSRRGITTFLPLKQAVAREHAAAPRYPLPSYCACSRADEQRYGQPRCDIEHTCCLSAHTA